MSTYNWIILKNVLNHMLMWVFLIKIKLIKTILNNNILYQLVCLSLYHASYI
jgi:hypothetical protein